MLKAFNLTREKFDINLMEEKNEHLELVLDALSKKEIPNDETTFDDLGFFCLSLVLEQRGDIIPKLDGAWCFQQNPFDPMMPRDARIDFIHKTTYLAVAILTFVDSEYPAISNQIDSYHEALRKGMSFAAKTELAGHAYEEADDLDEFLGYFVKGKVIPYLINDADFCPELSTLLENIKQNISQIVGEKRFYDLFGNNQEKTLKTIDEKLFML